LVVERAVESRHISQERISITRVRHQFFDDIGRPPGQPWSEEAILSLFVKQLGKTLGRDMDARLGRHDRVDEDQLWLSVFETLTEGWQEGPGTGVANDGNRLVQFDGSRRCLLYQTQPVRRCSGRNTSEIGDRDRVPALTGDMGKR